MDNRACVTRTGKKIYEHTNDSYNNEDGNHEMLGRERSSSDMKRLSDLTVPSLDASVRFPSAPLVAEEAVGLCDNSMARGNTVEPSLDYRLRERHVLRDSIENDSRLGVYCSPRFYRKTNYAAAGITHEDDSFSEEHELFGNNMENSPTESNGSSARSGLSKKSFHDNLRKKRPLSLVGLDPRRRMKDSQKPPPDGISNLGSSCCNLRTSLIERDYRIRSPTSRGVQQSNLSPFMEKTPSFQLSRSCSDLRDGLSPIHPTIQELRCPSHISLQSIRVSSPSESRVSLLSDFEVHERAHHLPRHADSPPLYPEVGGPPMSSDALVQEWLARQEKFSANRQTSDPLKVRTKTHPT